MKIILCFIRLNENGSFEKITWFKNQEGQRTNTKEIVQPTPEQALQIASAKYQSITVKS